MVDSTGSRGIKEPLSESDVSAIEAMQSRLSGNFYELLGVERSATSEQVREAYFQLSRKFHPDVFWRKDLAHHKSVVDAIFRDLTMAFDTLSSPRKRLPYDERLAAREGSRVDPKPKYPRASYADPAPTSVGPRPQAPVASSSQKPLVSPATTALRGPTLPTALRADESQKFIVGRAAVSPPTTNHHAPGARPNAAESDTDEHSRRREAALRFNSVTRSPNRNPSSTTPNGSPRVITPVATPKVVTPAATPAVLASPLRDPPDQAQALAPQENTTSRARVSDRPPPPGSGADARTSIESLMRQKLEKGIQNRLGLQTDFESQIADVRTSGDISELVAVLQQAVLQCPEVESFKSRLDRVLAAQQDEGAEALIQQARAAERAKNWELAVQRWSQAAAARPFDITVLLSAATAVLEHGQELPRAAEFARRATQVSPNSVTAHVMLSRVFHQAGREASSRAALEPALRLSPSAPEVLEMARKLNSR